MFAPSRSLPDLSTYSSDNDLPSTPPPESQELFTSQIKGLGLERAGWESSESEEERLSIGEGYPNSRTPRPREFTVTERNSTALNLIDSLESTLEESPEINLGRSRSESPYIHRGSLTEDDQDHFQSKSQRRNAEVSSIHSAPDEFQLSSPLQLSSPEIPFESNLPDSPEEPQQPSLEFRRTYERSQSEEGELKHRKIRYGLQKIPFSLWDYLQEEILTTETEVEEGVKSERVTNFLSVPGEVEMIILFGSVICLDSFLYTFTILPLRSLIALSHFIKNTIWNLFHSKVNRRTMRLSQKCDLAKVALVIGTVGILHRVTDASQMYHSVRGQETLKLYVIFNVLEIADRLCCSFGQDLQDSLFSRQTLGRRNDGSHPSIRPLALLSLNLGYVVAHTLVLFYQLVTLNVAINSYSNALLTLLLSNQFVEIKGSVFKKFEKEQLFQITCADIVERFQLALMLFIIALRNLIELSSASSSSLFSFLPASFSLSLSVPSLPTLSLLQTIFSPALIVILSECAVDWLKHAFITKFNHIRPAVYSRFIDVLCKDLMGGSGRRNQPFVDQSPIVSRRLGFASLPLGCLVVRVIFQAFEMLSDDSLVDECEPIIQTSLYIYKKNEGIWSKLGGWGIIFLMGIVIWASLVALKLIIGINLRAFAVSRSATAVNRLIEDDLNGRSRPHIGVTEAEKKAEKEISNFLKEEGFDVPGKLKGGSVELDSIGRYTMVRSRLW